MLRHLLPLVIFGLASPAPAADPAQDAAHVFTELAAALTAGNVPEFMAEFDPSTPGYDRIRTGVAGLAAQGETQSYLQVVKNEGDDRTRTLEVSWELRIRRSGDATPSARRQVQVVGKLALRGKHWRIVAFTPIDWLMP